jgi:transposase
MPKPYSEDLRERVIEAIESGASRREAAENFRLSPSSAVKWWRRWHDTGSVRAKPSGGSESPLEEHAGWLLALIAAQPDLTLDEIVTAMRKRRIPGSRTAVWRFFERHNLTFKKSPTGRRTATARRGTRTRTLEESAAHAESRPVGVHRRNCQQYQHGAA